MIRNRLAKWGLAFCALMGVVTAIAHLTCLVLGPECFKAQLAPASLVASAEAGTLFAPLATVSVSLLFLLASAYALSAMGVIPLLPLTTTALAVLAVLCTLRGLATIPLAFLLSDLMTPFSFVAGSIWLLVGIFYGVGFIQTRH